MRRCRSAGRQTFTSVRRYCEAHLDVAIVGAGAAGLATAIFTRRLNSRLPVLLLDGAKKPGAKILVSGGSRCNLTNATVSEHDFWGGSSAVVRRILRALPVVDTVQFFREIGVPLHEEADGKLFPISNRSRDVLDALLKESERLGVELRAGCRVLDVVRETEGFRLRTSQGDLRAASVVLATGGLSLPKTGSDGGGLGIAKRLGHTIVETTPALAPLLLSTETGSYSFHRALSGVAHDVELTIWVDGAANQRLSGALLWTHFGVSGPVALNASRHWMRAVVENKSALITINFYPGRSFDAVDLMLRTMGAERPKGSIQSALSTSLPASVAIALLESLAIDGRTPLSQLPKGTRRRLVHALVEWALPVTGTRGYNYAEATAGGVALAEIDPATMRSRICPNLYLVGEMLDVDGRIGGFNFQWAWSTAYAAARGLADTCSTTENTE